MIIEMITLMPLPLLPILAILGGGVIGGLIGGFIGSLFEEKENKLGVLGMQQAGKTKFLSLLRGEAYVERSTSIEKYEPFTIYLKGGKEVRISQGVDIGGGDTYRLKYKEIIENSDVVFYFFDINKYFKDEVMEDRITYRRECNSRFEFIFDKKQEKKVLIVATHTDLCGIHSSQIKSEFDKIVRDKRYKNMLQQVCFINLNDEKQVEEFINKTFK
ncbi:GTPase domain-containing protein [Capnocytophaga stomatis]|uniref:GTPase domain-containing protein n=1 Tax=Capnocytophaga stomatis TaxID=1848904 RepID=UPI003859D125